jgi:hypothetical protein
MKKPVGKVPTRQNDVFISGDYEQGLKILSRIIARSLIKQQVKKNQADIRSQTSNTPESSP